MPPIAFPDPLNFEYARWIRVGDYLYPADGVVHFGGELSVENLRSAYLKGIFPWYTDGIPLPWHCPSQRALLIFSDLKIPRSLRKVRDHGELTFSIDRDFTGVIRQCSLANRPGQRGTWITSDFERAYVALHEAGMAHSVEAWDDGDRLVGGLYGVDAGGVFCGESMFFVHPNASKLALLYLIDHLADHGSSWLDAQVMTPHIAALGATEVPRASFLRMLEEEQAKGLMIFNHVNPATGDGSTT